MRGEPELEQESASGDERDDPAVRGRKVRNSQLLLQDRLVEGVVKRLVGGFGDRDADPACLKDPKPLRDEQLRDPGYEIDRDDRLLRPPNRTILQNRSFLAVTPSPKSVKVRDGLREQNQRDDLHGVLDRALGIYDRVGGGMDKERYGQR